jgi:exosortase A-associated hydrolase 1
MSPATGIAREEAFTFGCEGESLLGVLHHPAADGPADVAGQTGVVVIVGGPQYRAGSHRQFVHLARGLADAGHPVLRFDVRGMGDSTGALRPFEQIAADIGAAIDAFVVHAPQVRRVVLWGLCDGASAALLYLHDRADARVRGLCLLNPWVRSEASLARTQVKHYYLDRLRQPAFWARLLRGQLARTAASEFWNNLRRARAGRAESARSTPGSTYQQRMLQGWKGFAGPSLLVLSGNDYTAKEFMEFTRASAAWQHLLRAANLQVRHMDSADHTFSDLRHKTQLQAITLEWVRRVGQPEPTTV